MTQANARKAEIPGEAGEAEGNVPSPTVAVIVGTRPEAIKMAPIVAALRDRDVRLEPLVISTGQHRTLLTQAFDTFGYWPEVDLELMEIDQSITAFCARALAALDAVFERYHPHTVLLQGDTITAHAAALAARYRRIRVGHVEAGLRSFNDDQPFPEELNRRAIAALANLHFAPTETGRQNLLREGIADGTVFVTGNTAIDALRSVDLGDDFEESALRSVPFDARRVLLVTAHRRESHGAGLRSICEAVAEVVAGDPSVEVVFPIHPHPNVRAEVLEILAGIDRVHLTAPVGYADLLRLLDRCTLVLSDSGGIQEETPSFETPLLVLRDVTERPEVVDSGAAILVGTDRSRIVAETRRLLDDQIAYRRMARAVNPFGDGRAAERIVAVLAGDTMPPLTTDRSAEPAQPPSEGPVAVKLAGRSTDPYNRSITDAIRRSRRGGNDPPSHPIFRE